MRNIEYKSFKLDSIKESDDEMIICGHASTFNNEDAVQPTFHNELKQYVMASDTVENGAFSKTISERKGRIAFCKNHNLDDPKGKIKELKEDEVGLYVEIRVSDAEPQLKTKIKEEIFTEFSIGYETILCSWDVKSDGTYVRKLKECKLYEISIVTIARDSNAKIEEIKSVEIIDSLIDREKNEQKKYQLKQLRLLMTEQPTIEATVPEEASTKSLDINKLKFL